MFFEYGNNFNQACEDSECATDLACGLFNKHKVCAHGKYCDARGQCKAFDHEGEDAWVALEKLRKAKVRRRRLTSG